jgi:hypothetical protein
MKATSSFKLSKTSKRIMATHTDPDRKANYKNMMIQAEVAASVRVKPSRSDRNDKVGE